MNVIKRCAVVAGWLRACPAIAVYLAASRVIGRERAFRSGSEAVAKVPGDLGVYARQAFYRVAARRCGRDVYIGFMSVFSKPDVEIADGVYVGRFCSIGWVELGDGAVIADGVQVLSGRHQHGHTPEDGAFRDQAQHFERVRIGAGAWLGANAVVMADVGERALVGAGAVVVKSVAGGDKVGGVPAKPITTRRAAA